MILALVASDFEAILQVINDAAHSYRGVIPDDRWKEPYMPSAELREKIEAGVRFFGWMEGEHLLGVTGIQAIKDVTLIRHAYVLPRCQREGIGARLLEHLLSLAETPEILVGTWIDATWATKFYEKYGFRLMSSTERDRLLQTYWSIPERQIEASVALRVIPSH
jgi:GNAT superfamily N-acetyltransferase